MQGPNVSIFCEPPFRVMLSRVLARSKTFPVPGHVSVVKLLPRDPLSLFQTILAYCACFPDAPKCSQSIYSQISVPFESFRQSHLCQAKLSSHFGPIQGLHLFEAYSLHLLACATATASAVPSSLKTLDHDKNSSRVAHCPSL